MACTAKGTRAFSIEQTVNIHFIFRADHNHAVRDRGKHKLHSSSRRITLRVLVLVKEFIRKIGGIIGVHDRVAAKDPHNPIAVAI